MYLSALFLYNFMDSISFSSYSWQFGKLGSILITGPILSISFLSAMYESKISSHAKYHSGGSDM